MTVGAEQRVVVLSSARSPVERELVADWAREGLPDGTRIVPASAAALAEPLAVGDDPLLLPVRVAWLPRERHGDRRARLTDVLLLNDPRRPRPRLQRRIARREPDRMHVLAGEPATVSELHGLWVEEAGGVGGPRGFAAWVARRATLAVDRAERRLVGDRYKVPNLVAEQVSDSAAFRTQVAALAERSGEPEEAVASRAEEALREMVAVRSPLAIDLWSAVMKPLHGRAWEVRVDVDGLEALRDVNRRHGLVFLPSHRSYADPLVLAEILDDHGFPRNHILGGINMAFWPIGSLARRAGVVFIKRSSRDDEPYKLALREYLAYLAGKRFNLEWYVEGGRSRTGKLRPPSYGLLRYLVEAVESDRVQDVLLVPVSITYDQLHEVGGLAEQERGAEKEREGLGWLARYVRAQQRPTGAVHVNFADPISVRDRIGRGDSLQVQKLTFEVLDRINGETPIVANSLVTLTLLGIPDRSLTLAQVRSALEPLLVYVHARELPLRDGGRLRSAAGVRDTLGKLVRAGVVTVYADGTEPVYAIERGRHQAAAFYRNSAAHWFVNRSLVELALVGGTTSLEDAWRDALRLRRLLEHEFFFPDKDRFREELTTELHLLTAGREDGDGHALVSRSPLLLAHRVLRAFFEAYLVVADRLADRDPRMPISDEELTAECMAVGRQLLLQGRLHSPESVSTQLFATAIALARQRDLVDPGREELAHRRRAFLDEVADVVHRVATVADLDGAGRPPIPELESSRVPA